jgi:hypothetical protein
MYVCKYCNYNTSKKYNFENHNKTAKHFKMLKNIKMESNGNFGNNKIVKAANSANSLDKPSYKILKKSATTSKIADDSSQNILKKTENSATLLDTSSQNILKKIEILSQYIDDSIINSNNFVCEYCKKSFKNRSGLWKHKKKCDTNKITNKDYNINLIEFLIKENSDFKNLLLQQNQLVMNLIEKNGNNINNTINNNSHNKTFNLQLFLNETCKNAMNLSEFIENMTVELPDLENMGKLGYVEGVSNIIIKNLKALEITQRPIHCSDEKRETVMIKDNNVWFKEGDDRENLRKIVSTVISRNLVLLNEYQEKYPDCNTYDSHRSDEYTKIIMETATNQAEKKKEKIFKLIAREVVIDKTIL